MSDERYHATIRELSDRLVEVQRPIRILDAIKWDPAIQARFFEQRAQELPPVGRSYYESRPLGFDPAAKRDELRELERDVQRQLGQFNPVGGILKRMCREYESVVRMLEARGTAEFGTLSKELYGSAQDAFHAGAPTLADLGAMMSETLENVEASMIAPNGDEKITGEEAVRVLQERLDRYFEEPGHPVRVIPSDGIIADAAAGSDYIKLRRDATFDERELRILEIHEGWVHLGTTLNGLRQPVCTFLGKGPPSSTVTQEGLAVLTEVLALATHPPRIRRTTNRIVAIDMAERGASFLDVYRFFREQRFSESESYGNTTRVFRGSVPDGQPFTKDISYSKGFVLTYNFIQLAVRRGLLSRIPLLFCGKTTLEDNRILADLVEEGIVLEPRFLPPPFSDLSAIVAWMSYSNFLNRLNLERIAADYAGIL